MKFNKRCLTAFSEEHPFMAMGTKSKLFDTSFSLTSELFLYDYSTGVQHPALLTDNKFYRLRWCEGGKRAVLATGNEDGKVSLYTPVPESGVSFELLASCSALEGDVHGLDYNASKGILAAGSSNGKIIFWNLNKMESQYTSDIPLTSNITCLSWNKKVSRILCAGTDDGKILILDIRAKNVAMTLGNDEMAAVTDVMWHPNGSTSIIATTNQRKLQCFNLSSDSTQQIGNHAGGLIGLSMIDCSHVAACSKEQIDIVDLESNSVTETMPVEGVFEVSFSKRDPLMALSYTGGTTEIVSRATKNIIPRCAGCIVDDRIVGASMYRIEDEPMEDVEENGFMKKIKNAMYKDGAYRLDRKELGELLLAEEAGIDRDAEDGVKDMTMGLRLDLNDPLTLTLIRGDMEKAYKESVSSGKTVPLSLFLALANGRDSLSLDSDDVLTLLSTAQVTSTFSHVLDKISNSQWKAVLSLLSFSVLSDPEFTSHALRISERLDSRDKLLVYAITNRLDKYFELKTSIHAMPKSVFEARSFFQAYKSVVADLESMGGTYKSPVLSEYFWYAAGHGERPAKITYDDLGININLGKASSAIQKPVSAAKRSPVFENAGSQERVQASAPAARTSSAFARQEERSLPSMQEPMQPKPTSFKSIPQPGLYTASQSVGSTPSFAPAPPAPRTLIPKPGQMAAPQGVSTYASMSQSSLVKPPGFAAPPQAQGSVSTYGTMPQERAKPLIPKPSLGSASPSMRSPKLAHAPMPQAASIPAPATYARASPPQAARAPEQIPVQQSLDAEEILNTFEAIIQDLTERASSKANLIIRNKLKEVTKRLSIYTSIPRDTFGASVLGGIDRINREIRNDSNSEEMKHKVREAIERCTEAGENRADLWMPSVYTLLQIVYH